MGGPETRPGTACPRPRPPPQICLMIGMAHVLVVYRVLAAAVFSNSALPFLEDQVTTAVVVTGALVHYVTILIMTKVGRWGRGRAGRGVPAEARGEPRLRSPHAGQQERGPEALRLR